MTNLATAYAVMGVFTAIIWRAGVGVPLRLWQWFAVGLIWPVILTAGWWEKWAWPGWLWRAVGGRR